jgi:biopolymer transport protein ExbD
VKRRDIFWAGLVVVALGILASFALLCWRAHVRSTAFLKGDGLTWGPAVDGLQAGLTVTTPRAAHQADLRLVGMIRNVGRQPVTIMSIIASDASRSLVVRDLSGKVLSNCALKLPSGPVSDTLTPGQTVSYNLDLHIFAARLPAGRYVATYTDGELASAPVEVEITPWEPGAPANARALVVVVERDDRFHLDGLAVNAVELERRIGEAAQRRSDCFQEDEPLRVIIGANHQAPYKLVQQVMMMCMQHRVWHVSFGIHDGGPADPPVNSQDNEPRRKWR